MYFYFLNCAKEYQAKGKPVNQFVLNAIHLFEIHSLRTLMEKLDDHNLTIWTLDETQVIKYNIRNNGIIIIGNYITVEKTSDGLLCLMGREPEPLMTVSEEDFIPKVLELFQQRQDL